jgi:DNA-binding transcriptional MerR regulator
MAARPGSRPPKKIFHKIGEVCELTKTEPYVLRYWESEFPFLAPEKNRAGQRIYTDDDIQTVLAIKRLLYEEGYTTAGARRRLEKEREESQAQDAPEGLPAPRVAGAPAAAASDDLGEALRNLREGLLELRRLLSSAPMDVDADPGMDAPAAMPARSRRPRR